MSKFAEDKVTDLLPITNLMAEGQKEYNTLPAYKVGGVVAFALELDEEDIKKILMNKRVYIMLINGNDKMQPINVQVDSNDFDEAVAWNQDWLKGRGFIDKNLEVSSNTVNYTGKEGN